MIHPFLMEKLPTVIGAFKKYKVRRAYAFGSVVTADFGDKSDIDFLITLQPGLAPGEYTDCFWGLYFQLPEILGRRVDLVMSETVRNPFFKPLLKAPKN